MNASCCLQLAFFPTIPKIGRKIARCSSSVPNHLDHPLLVLLLHVLLLLEVHKY